MPRRDESDDSSTASPTFATLGYVSALISSLPPSHRPRGGHIDRFRFVMWLTNYEEAM